MKRKIALGLILGVLGGGTAGLALAGVDRSEVNAPAVSSDDCPEIAAALERAGVPSLEFPGTACPPLKEVQGTISDLKRDLATIEAEAGGS